MVELIKNNNELIVGTDGGNITTKVSFLNTLGNIENFVIPTVIAPAPDSATSYNNQVDKPEEIEIEDFIHIRVDSKALDANENNKSWYVGDSAKESSQKLQPSLTETGEAEDKFSDTNSKIFVLPVLSGMAIAALKSEKRNVRTYLGTGVPSKTFLKHEQTLSHKFVGTHKITFIDGPFAGEIVTLTIEKDDATIHAESVTTAIALKYDIENGELFETQLNQQLEGKTFTISDLGGGTSDYAVFNETGLDKIMTRRFAEENNGEFSRIGTNPYVDRIIEAVYNDDAFKANRELIEKLNDKNRRPAELNSREIFMKKIVKPAVMEAIKKGVEPKFTFSWARFKNVDITKHVIAEMKKYAELQSPNINAVWITANSDYMAAVGGGLLFGYFGGLRELDDVIIPNLEDSQYFTSKAYLIVTYLMWMQKAQELQEQ